MPPDPAGAPEATALDPARSDASIRRRRRARRRRSSGSKALTYLGLALGTLVVLFPIYVLVVQSLLQPLQLAANPPQFFPNHPAFSNYTSAMTTFDFGLYLRNSFIQTGIIVLAQVVTSVLAAYAFAFLRFPLRRTLFVVVLATIMVPFEVTVVVNYDTVAHLGWAGNFLGLTVPFLATGFGIFLVRQAFLAIPRELKEAAVIDGYGPVRFLYRVAIPLARPVIAALAVFSFLGAWNQYLWPELLTANPQGQSIRTVQIGLGVIGSSSSTAGVKLAAAVISLVPLVILLVFFRKNLIRSLTAGAVK